MGSTLDNLNASTAMANLNKLRQNQQNSLKCEICDKEFKSNKGLKNHLKIVHKLMEKNQCNICQKDFKLHRQLTCHVKIVHGNKKYFKCDYTLLVKEIQTNVNKINVESWGMIFKNYAALP